MYKIVALMGEAGAGKDSLMRSALDVLDQKGHASKIHEIISCTTRPMREGEVNGVNYFYYTPDQFSGKIISGEMLEFVQFNGWWYGTSYESIRGDNIINIGVFNPTGIRELIDSGECEVFVFWVRVSDKQRLMRQLTREEDPNVKEIIRRFGADTQDFSHINFDYVELTNETLEDYDAAVDQIVGQVQTLLGQGQE